MVVAKRQGRSKEGPRTRVKTSAALLAKPSLHRAAQVEGKTYEKRSQSTFLPFFKVQVPLCGKMLFYGIAGLLAMVRLNDTNALFVYNVFYLDSLQGFKCTIINPHRVVLYV